MFVGPTLLLLLLSLLVYFQRIAAHPTKYLGSVPNLPIEQSFILSLDVGPIRAYR